MASLRKRGKNYSIVFSRRVDGELEQAVYSLGTDSESEAEELKVRYGGKHRRGEIDPFNGWNPSIEKRRERKQKTGGTLTEAIDDFLASRSHVKESTLRGYEKQLRNFALSVGRTMPVSHVNDKDIRDYCFQSSHSRATKRTYLRHCRMLFNWLEQEGRVETNVAAKVDYPKQQRKVAKKAIRESHLQQIIWAFKDIQREKIRAGKRRGLHPWFKPAVALGFYAGLRRSEMTKLTWECVDLDSCFLYVTDTKNGKERAVPMQQPLARVLTAWYRLTGSPRTGLVLFKSNFPGQHRGRKQPLTGDNLTKVFKEYARAAEMPEEVTLHGLRHSFATEMLRAGFSLNEVADMAGHDDVTVTRDYYEHLNQRDLQRKMDKLGL